jgi:RHS repeat-associated protein
MRPAIFSEQTSDERRFNFFRLITMTIPRLRQQTLTCSLFWAALKIVLVLAAVGVSRAQTYTSNPAVDSYKNVGFAYRMKVTAINGSNVTFRIDPVGPSFGSAGRAVVRMDSTAGTLVGIGPGYGIGATTAGNIEVDMASLFTSGTKNFYVHRQFWNSSTFQYQDDTSVWDGPIAITATNGPPSVSVWSATMQSGDLTVTWTAYDDITSSIGTDLYISKNGNLNEFDPARRATPANSINGVQRTYTYTASTLATYGMIPGASYRVRVNVADGSVPQLHGVNVSPTFTYELPPFVELTGLTPSQYYVYRGQSVTWTYSIRTNYFSSLLLGGSLNTTEGTQDTRSLHYLSSPLASLPTDGITRNYANPHIAIRADAPQGSNFGLRGALWEDINGPGFIDPSDIQRGSTFNTNGISLTVYPSYVAHMGNASASITPTGTLTPGQEISINYMVYSNGPAKLRLGANFGPGFDLGDIEVNLASGWNYPSMIATVPLGITSGNKNLRALLWQDINRSNSINTGDLPLPGDGSGSANPTILLSNVAVSRPPVISAIQTPVVNSAARTVSITFSASDPDGGTMNDECWLFTAGGDPINGASFTSPSSNFGNSNQTAILNIPTGTPSGSYKIRIRLFNSAGAMAEAFSPEFSYQAPDPVGPDLHLLNGKKVGGLIHIPGYSVTPPEGQYWTRFYIVRGNVKIAQAAGDFPSSVPDLGFLIWHKMSADPDFGDLAMRWTDILDGPGPFTLKIVGETIPGNPPVESAPFTVTLQDDLELIVEASDLFPRYKSLTDPPATLFTASSAGGSGPVTLRWGVRDPDGSGQLTGEQISQVINGVGLNVIRCVATDTSGNRTVEGVTAPIAQRDRRGGESAEDGGSISVNAVDVVSGNLHLAFEDMNTPAIGVPFSVTRSYNSCPQTSAGVAAPPVGSWTFSLEQTIKHNQTNNADLNTGYDWPTVQHTRGDGSVVEFYPGLDGHYHPSTPGVHDQLVENFSAGTFTLYTADTPPLAYVFRAVDEAKRADALYRLQSVKTLRGHGLTVHYSSETKINEVHDDSGRKYTFFYDDTDAPTRISRVSDFSGRNVYYDWDTNGNLKTVTDVRGKISRFEYHGVGDGNKRLVYFQRPRGNRPFSNIIYDNQKRVVQLTQPMGTTNAGTSISANANYNYQTSYTHVSRALAGNDLRFDLDSNRNIFRITESHGTGMANRETTIGRLRNDQLGPNDNAKYRASDLGLTTSVQPPPGSAATTTYAISSNGRGLVTQINDGNGSSDVTYPQSVLEAAPGTLPKNLALPTAITDARRKIFNPQFEATGELQAFRNPYGQGKSIEFHPDNGLPQFINDGRNNITEYRYTTTGDISRVIVPFDPDNTRQAIIFDYPGIFSNRGFPTTITDRNGNVTSMIWDESGNPTHIGAENLPIGAGESKNIVFRYDDNGNRDRITDRRGKTTDIVYDDMDRPVRMIEPSPDGGTGRPTTTTEYDLLGRPTKVTNPNGNIIERVYGTAGSGAGLLVNVLAHRPGNNPDTIQEIIYLSDGRTASIRDGEGITRNYVYKESPRHHLVHRINEPMPNGSITFREYDYNANDQVTRETIGTTDASVTQILPDTRYEYDDAGRLKAVVNVMGGGVNIRTEVTYHPDDQINTILDPRQRLIAHHYNSQGRLSRRVDANEWTYQYDGNGNLSSERFPGDALSPPRTITRTWGVLDRLVKTNYGDGVTPEVSYTYDANNNRTGMSDRWGSVTYGYDGLNRPISIIRNLSAAQTLQYSYFPGGQIQSITYPGNRTVNYTYDHQDRMKTVTPWAPGGSFVYTWRRNGQLQRITNPNGTQTDYEYLPSNGRLSRLLSSRSGTVIADQQFTYDPVGNITRIQGDLPLVPPVDPAVTMTADDANRLASIAGQLVTNDPAGRSQSIPGPLNATTVWEGMDWLSRYTSGTVTTNYGYDGDGVRLWRSSSAGSTTRYLVDPTAEMPNVVVESDASNNPQRFYIHGASGLLASIDAAGTGSTYHFSHRGDTLALTNAGGNVTESYGYSPYGVTVSANATWNPFRFIGQHGVMDEGNGLQFMRARYYSPSVGRFLSMDQLPGSATEGQTLNRFAYATGEPIMKVDPSGFSVTQKGFIKVTNLLADGINIGTKFGSKNWCGLGESRDYSRGASPNMSSERNMSKIGDLPAGKSKKYYAGQIACMNHDLALTRNRASFSDFENPKTIVPHWNLYSESPAKLMKRAFGVAAVYGVLKSSAKEVIRGPVITKGEQK